MKLKTRYACAIVGVAIAAGTVAFMQGLAEANDHQALAVATRLLEEVPVAADARVADFALDYRPGGRVMQGPPLMACAATVPDAGRRAASVPRGECLVTRSLFAARRLPVPPVGTELALIGQRKTHRLKIAGFLDWEKPLRGYPNCFVAAETAAAIDEEWRGWEPKTAAELAPGFTGDAARDFGRAKALLLWGAALTALCLLVNTLFLTVEARRRELAVLRMVGMTRGGVVERIFGLSCGLAVAGDFLGVAVAWAALWVYVRLDPATFPMGMGPLKARGAVFAASVLVAVLAALLALRPALKVRPLEAASARAPRKRHLGMLVSFACGFGAFVAVEVWGASLMRAFVPSPEWPDAIVSILPGGVSSFDIARLRDRLPGVRRVHELAPLQVNFDPLEKLEGRNAGGGAGGAGRRGGGRAACRNALLLGSDWLPEFRFVAGTREEAEKAIRSGDACVITEMMARARRLALGDEVRLDCGRGLRMALRVAGIVDLNWHMVTSRGLVRGLNRMPSHTDGPLFVSFDTVEACDARPAPFVKMTHLWLDYDPDFLAAHGPFEAGRRVEREIVVALGLLGVEASENAVRLHSRDEVADGTLAHGAELIGAMARVPFVFLAVVSLGFVAMLVGSFDSRRHEFRVLRAVGATRMQLARLLAGEALRVAVGGIALGFAGGALVGWLCTGGTRAAMAGWGLPPSFAVPLATVARGALGAIAFALAVAIPTALALIGPLPRLRTSGVKGVAVK